MSNSIQQTYTEFASLTDKLKSLHDHLENIDNRLTGNGSKEDSDEVSTTPNGLKEKFENLSEEQRYIIHRIEETIEKIDLLLFEEDVKEGRG